MEDRKILNLERLREETEVSDDTLRAMLQVFLEEAPLSLKKITEAAGQDVPEKLRSASHALKGSAAVMGAEELSGLCKEIQFLAEAGDLAGARAVMPRLLEAFEKTMENIKKELKKLSEG